MNIIRRAKEPRNIQKNTGELNTSLVSFLSFTPLQQGVAGGCGMREESIGAKPSIRFLCPMLSVLIAIGITFSCYGYYSHYC